MFNRVANAKRNTQAQIKWEKAKKYFKQKTKK